MRKLTRLFSIGAVIAACLSNPLMAQPADQPAAASPQTVWSGVYSNAQAFRGEKVVDTSCLGCHGAGLAGGDSGPRLVGDAFLSGWENRSVGDLFDWILAKMPDDAPGTLKPEDAASVIAYILQVNNMPAGRQALPADRDALARIIVLAAKP